MKIILMMAITADGKIAKDSNQFANWTSPEDKKMFAKISKECGVILMGENTFNTFPAPLKDRLNVVFSEKENISEVEGLKWVKGDPKKVLAELEEMGYQKALLGGGSFLNSLFAKDNLIDEIILTIEPKVFGSGLSLFNTDLEMKLKLMNLESINENTVMLHYQVIKE